MYFDLNANALPFPASRIRSGHSELPHFQCTMSPNKRFHRISRERKITRNGKWRNGKPEMLAEYLNTTYPIIAKKCWKVWSLKRMNEMDKFGAIHRIRCGKRASAMRKKNNFSSNVLLKILTKFKPNQTKSYRGNKHSCKNWVIVSFLADLADRDRNHWSFSLFKRCLVLSTCSCCFFRSSCNLSINAMYRSCSFRLFDEPWRKKRNELNLNFMNGNQKWNIVRYCSPTQRPADFFSIFGFLFRNFCSVHLNRTWPMTRMWPKIVD